MVVGRDSSERGAASERVAPAPPINETPSAGPGRLAGYVRDVNGSPVPRTVVKAAGTSVVADRRGRYELRVPAGETTVVAEHPLYVPQQVSLMDRPAGGRLDFSLAVTKPGVAGPDSADRLIFWTGCDDVAALSRDQVAGWISLGVDGFVCTVGRLASAGGEHSFSGDPDAEQSDERYALQRELRASAAVRMARAGELKLYLGFYASNAMNAQTPFAEWFDDEAWSMEVLPEVRELAAAARALGFAGVAIDQELYPVSGATDASWAWDYAGEERSEDEVRGQVAERGRQLMTALLDGYPGVELAAYDTELPESWSERVQEEINDSPVPFERDVRIDLWDGLSSVPGYSAILWFDATFYKTPHLGDDWAPALRYNASRVYSLLSRRFSNWSYASSRLHLSPFSWIDAGPSEFERARDPAYVAAQLAAFREWGAGGTFANYDNGALDDFDYEPYAEALQGASAPATVDRRPPRLVVGSPVVDDELVLSGTATDNLAIRAVRWYDDLGRFGTAELDWDVQGTTSWRLEGVPAPPGRTRLTIVAEDIKGLAATHTLTVTP
jgi:hypothetical protein